jgi:adenylosuccinate synthase
MKNVDIIADLQFGSTGKGLLAGFLGKRIGHDTFVTANAPNAGHTYTEADDTKWVVRQLPVGACLPSAKRIMIGPGAVINPETLIDEIHEITKRRISLGRGRMPDPVIHPQAAVVTAEALRIEQELVKIGSTMKGSGAALAMKLMRGAMGELNTAGEWFKKNGHGYLASFVVSHERYMQTLDEGRCVMLEGSQGYSLGVSSGFYPHTTSRECTPAQMLSDTLIPWTRVNKVIGVCRTYPIRVSNRKVTTVNADNGTEMGNVYSSGPGYSDQEEISFEALGQETEVTTVTKLPRRIFTFSRDQIAQAIWACQPTEVFLNFANYDPDLAVRLKGEIDAMMAASCADAGEMAGVRYMGFGPKESDIRIMNHQYTMDLGPDGRRIGL